VNLLIDNARRLLETAVAAAGPGGSQEWTVLYGPEGGLQILAGTDRSLESLTLTHGATAVWHVNRRCGRITVEGLSHGERIRLETEAPASARLLTDLPLYQLNGS